MIKKECKGGEGEERLKKGNKRERDRKRGLIRGRKGGETGRVREKQTNRLIKGKKGGEKGSVGERQGERLKKER